MIFLTKTSEMTEASKKGSVCARLSHDKSLRECVSYYLRITAAQGQWLARGGLLSLLLLKMLDFVHVFWFALLITKAVSASVIIQDSLPLLYLFSPWNKKCQSVIRLKVHKCREWLCLFVGKCRFVLACAFCPYGITHPERGCAHQCRISPNCVV